MKKIIHSTLDEEHLALRIDNRRTFSVRLSLSVELEAGDVKDTVPNVYKAFFADIKAFAENPKKFKIYSVVNNVLQPHPLDDAKFEVISAAYNSQLADRFVKWFDSRVSKLDHRGAGTSDSQDVSDQEITGFHALMGAASWTAPLPHELGLTHIITIANADLPDMQNLVAAPLIGEIIPVDPQPPAKGQLVDIALEAGAAYSCKASVSTTPADTDSLLEDSGFIKNDDADAGERGARMRRIERRAGSLFTGFFAASEFTCPKSLDEQLQNSENDWALQLGCFAWQTAAIFSAAFDTALIALFMPGADKRDGQLLAPFLDILVRDGLSDPAAPDDPPLDFAGLSDSVRRRGFRQAIREGLQIFVNGCRLQGFDDPIALKLDDLWKMAGLEKDALKLARAFIEYSISASRNAKDYDALIEVIKTQLQIKNDIVDWPKSKYEDIQRHLAGDLAALNDTLLSEEGTERLLVDLLQREEIRTKVANLWWSNAPPADDIVKSRYNLRIASLRNFLDSGVNGAEGARHSVGSLIADMEASPGREYVLEFWKNRLTAGLFKRQKSKSDFSIVDHAIFIQLARPLEVMFSRIPDEALKRKAIELASKAVDDAASGISKDAKEQFDPPGERFIPDSAPGPLLLHIPLDPEIDDDDGVDEITASFAGLGVLVRRSQENWAYACLAEALEPELQLDDPRLDQYAPSEALPGNNHFSIAPLPSASVDNRRELFLSYDGLPFASNAFSGAISKDDEEARVPPLYQLDYPDAERLGKLFEQLKPLAYGTLVDFAVHVIGRSGLLPEALRGDAPWLPKPKLDPNLLETASFVVSRRTAIGQAAISGALIGKQTEGLLPLSKAYPRLAVESEVKADVMRNSDGLGALTLPKEDGDARTFVLRDIEVWSGDAITLEIAIGLDDSSDASGVVSIRAPDLTDFVPEITITFTKTSANTIKIDATRGGIPLAVNPDTFNRNNHNGVWLRLKTNKDIVCLAAPDADSGENAATTRPIHDKLLLLGTPTGRRGFWLDGIKEAEDIQLSLPRMTYQDFMRWTNNPRLAKGAMELPDTAPDNDPRLKILEAFRTLLVALDMDRLESPKEAECLDKLPDLAVTAVRLTALPLDSLASDEPDTPGNMPRTGPWPHKLFSMPSLWSLLASYKDNLLIKGEHDSLKINPNAKIVSILQEIDKSLSRRITIEASMLDNTLKIDGDNKLIVPGGNTVRLSVRTIVEAKHFQRTGGNPPALDPLLRKLAVADNASNFTFDGSHLVIETMIGPLEHAENNGWKCSRENWARDREKLLRHRPTGLARRYDLTLKPERRADWRWRQVGEVTTQTQAWRFDGKPIYSWIDPQRFSEKSDRQQATLLLKPNKSDKHFEAFEKELFQDRTDDEAQPCTVTLRPLSHETSLLTIEADQHRGATFYRHALEIKSRYAAAMRTPMRDGLSQAWSDPKQNGGEIPRWMRIAVLAARPARDLTRPQLRALLPLTRRPDPRYDEATIAPPILALLQEEPLAFGGLAVRIATEIRTGVGYGVLPRSTEPDHEPVVVPLDVRKEVGPDPRLSYRAWAEQDARGAVLSPEGPIGLTFDRDAKAGASFANTALILHPEVTGGTGARLLEESFISVGMRRFLDPNWLIPEDPIVPDILALDRGALWIENTSNLRLEFVEEGSSNIPSKVIKALVFADQQVKIDRRAIDITVSETFQGPDDPAPLHLCNIQEESSLVLLVVPQGKGLLSVSALQVKSSFANDLPQRGAGMTPLVVASIEMSIPKGAFVTLHGGEARLSAASALTAMNWVRTNPDFQRVTIAGADQPLNVEEIVMLKQGPSLTFARSDPTSAGGRDALWIRPLQALQRTPTHTQRHIVILLSETLRGIGRDIERPRHAWLMPAATLSLNETGQTGCDTARIIEIETPADLMGWLPNSNLLPERYRHAFFDLASIGALASSNKRLLFRLRHIGGVDSLPAATRLQIGFRTSPRDESIIDLNLTSSGVVEIIAQIDVTFVSQEFRAATLSNTWAVLKTGQIEKIPVDMQLNAQVRTLQSVVLSIQSITAGPAGNAYDGPAWFETSLFVDSSEHDSAWRFNFDWLFGLEQSRLAEVFDYDRLAERVEAQARIIKVSPPIKIRTES